MGDVEGTVLDVGHGGSLAEVSRGDEVPDASLGEHDGLSVEHDNEVFSFRGLVEFVGLSDGAAVAPTEDDSFNHSDE